MNFPNLNLMFNQTAIYMLGGILLLLTSCVRVPKEAVLLSEAVGERIAAIQTAHEALVSDYFQRSRETVDQFIVEKYTPEFMGKFVRRAGLMDMLSDPEVLSEEVAHRIRDEVSARGSYSDTELDEILAGVNSGMGDPERGQIVSEFAAAAQEQINKQRTEMIKKVDDAERQLMKELRANYAELYQMQSTVTAHIRSVHKVVKAQDNILRKLNLMEQRDQIIDQTISVNERIVSLFDAAKEADTLIQDFMEIQLTQPSE